MSKSFPYCNKTISNDNSESNTKRNLATNSNKDYNTPYFTITSDRNNNNNNNLVNLIPQHNYKKSSSKKISTNTGKSISNIKENSSTNFNSSVTNTKTTTPRIINDNNKNNNLNLNLNNTNDETNNPNNGIKNYNYTPISTISNHNNDTIYIKATNNTHNSNNNSHISKRNSKNYNDNIINTVNLNNNSNVNAILTPSLFLTEIKLNNIKKLCSVIKKLERNETTKQYVNAKDFNNNTCLHLAVLNNNIELIKLLLEYGAEVNYVNNNDESALFFSLYSRNEDVFNMLLSYGSDPLIKNNKNLSVVDLCLNSISTGTINTTNNSNKMSGFIRILKIHFPRMFNNHDDGKHSGLHKNYTINYLNNKELNINNSHDNNFFDNNLYDDTEIRRNRSSGVGETKMKAKTKKRSVVFNYNSNRFLEDLSNTNNDIKADDADNDKSIYSYNIKEDYDYNNDYYYNDEINNANEQNNKLTFKPINNDNSNNNSNSRNSLSKQKIESYIDKLNLEDINNFNNYNNNNNLLIQLVKPKQVKQASIKTNNIEQNNNSITNSNNNSDIENKAYMKKLFSSTSRNNYNKYKEAKLKLETEILKDKRNSININNSNNTSSNNYHSKTFRYNKSSFPNYSNSLIKKFNTILTTPNNPLILQNINSNNNDNDDNNEGNDDSSNNDSFISQINDFEVRINNIAKKIKLEQFSDTDNSGVISNKYSIVNSNKSLRFRKYGNKRDSKKTLNDVNVIYDNKHDELNNNGNNGNKGNENEIRENNSICNTDVCKDYNNMVRETKEQFINEFYDYNNDNNNSNNNTNEAKTIRSNISNSNNDIKPRKLLLKTNNKIPNTNSNSNNSNIINTKQTKESFTDMTQTLAIFESISNNIDIKSKYIVVANNTNNQSNQNDINNKNNSNSNNSLISENNMYLNTLSSKTGEEGDLFSQELEAHGMNKQIKLLSSNMNYYLDNTTTNNTYLTNSYTNINNNLNYSNSNSHCNSVRYFPINSYKSSYVEYKNNKYNGGSYIDYYNNSKFNNNCSYYSKSGSKASSNRNSCNYNSQCNNQYNQYVNVSSNSKKKDYLYSGIGLIEEENSPILTTHNNNSNKTLEKYSISNNYNNYNNENNDIEYKEYKYSKGSVKQKQNNNSNSINNTNTYTNNRIKNISSSKESSFINSNNINSINIINYDYSNKNKTNNTNTNTNNNKPSINKGLIKELFKSTLNNHQDKNKATINSKNSINSNTKTNSNYKINHNLIKYMSFTNSRIASARENLKSNNSNKLNEVYKDNKDNKDNNTITNTSINVSNINTTYYINNKKLVEFLSRINLLKHYNLFVNNGFEDVEWLVNNISNTNTNITNAITNTNTGNINLNISHSSYDIVNHDLLKIIGVELLGERVKILLALENEYNNINTNTNTNNNLLYIPISKEADVYYIPGFLYHCKSNSYTNTNSTKQNFNNNSVRKNTSNNTNFSIFDVNNITDTTISSFTNDDKCYGIKLWLQQMNLDIYWLMFLQLGYYSFELLYYQSLSKYVIIII